MVPKVVIDHPPPPLSSVSHGGCLSDSAYCEGLCVQETEAVKPQMGCNETRMRARVGTEELSADSPTPG